ncbi:O-antigen ligase family protein [Kordiimonas pumila]|uniref:O-antigen ligase family protein n=1 Tax=Kordiimonas pumila TaxID=2161677 RepID=A0ABV7D5L9_9PROT|nr:O-antigen ligase family protein [Kordiimonas pumila]
MISLIVTAYCVYGLIVYFSGNGYVLWYERQASFGALTSTFVNRNSFAAYAGIGVQCMLAYMLWTYTHKTEMHVTIKDKIIQFLTQDLTKNVMIALSLIILLSGLFLTASRAGIMTSLAGSLLLIMLSTLKATPNPSDVTKRNKHYFFIASLTALALLTFNLSGELFSNRMNTLNYNDMRFLAYPIMMDTIAENPIKGIGIGTFVEYFSQYRPEEMPRYFNKGHNDVLEIIMTAGLFAGGLFILSFLFITIWMFYSAFKSVEHKIFLFLGGTVSIQMGLHSLVDFPLQMPAISYFFTSILAACAFILARERSKRPL